MTEIDYTEKAEVGNFPLSNNILTFKAGIDPVELKEIKIEEVDVFGTLTEGLHQIALEQKAWKVSCIDNAGKEKILWVAQGFNSADIVTWGLQVSQLGAVADLTEEPVGKNGETPMVLRIGNIARVQDQPLAEESTLTILLKNPQRKRGLIAIKDAEILDQDRVIGRTSMTMSRLSPRVLSEGGKDRLRDPQKIAKVIQAELAKYPEAAQLEDSSVPGFGGDLEIINRRQISEDEQIGFVRMPADVFLGHFDDFPIIPLTGISQTVAWAIFEDCFKNLPKDSKFFDISRVKAISVIESILPEDILMYSVKTDKENTYSINVYFLDKNGEKVKAISFKEVIISSENCLNELWHSKAVINAFGKQNTIKEYKKHLAHLYDFCRTAIEKVIERREARGEIDFNLRILDVGVGSSANVSIQILNALQEVKREYKEIYGAIRLKVYLTITDVNNDITGKAEKEIKQHIDKLDNIVQAEIEIQQIPHIERGKIVPAEYVELIGLQDIAAANFSLDYNCPRKSILDLREKVAIGGQVILGLVNRRPPYKIATNVITTRMQNTRDFTYFNHYKIMAYTGIELTRMGHFSREYCQYTTCREIIEMLEQAGFEVVATNEDTFLGIGKLIHGELIRVRRAK